MTSTPTTPTELFGFDPEETTYVEFVEPSCPNCGSTAVTKDGTYTRYPHGRSADEDLEDVVRVDLGVLAEVQSERAGEGVDEEVKKLVFVYFAVCLRETNAESLNILATAC